MSTATLRIATRESPLAVWQAEHVQARLRAAHRDLEVTLLPMTTTGDQRLEGALSAVGGKGLFVKELEQALLDRRADLAVHSMKDVPAEQPEGLRLAVFLAGEDPRDAFVSNRYARLDDLPEGACVGTSSLRRQTQLRHLRPDLRIEVLRGNVGTRLRKLDEGQYDAILLACAGLIRLGLGDRIRQALPVDTFVPAVGQGVVGIECRQGDDVTLRYLAALADPHSTARLAAERAFNAELGGSCQVPVAGHATLRADRIRLDGLIGDPDGAQVRDQIEGAVCDAADLGRTLAQRLLAAGGDALLARLAAN